MVLASAAMGACGGGGGGADDAVPQLALRAALVPQGTLVTCDAKESTPARLTRSADGETWTQDITCPAQFALTGDYQLSTWQVVPLPVVERAGVAVGTMSAATALPAPVVLRTGEGVFVVGHAGLDRLGDAPAVLERVTSTGERAEAYAPTGPSVQAALVPGSDDLWRWAATRAGTAFVSSAVKARAFTVQDLGASGALALGDPMQDNHPALLGGPAYRDAGLSALLAERAFRDIRFVDLDNDGRQDVVSNVYGSGCTLIAMARADGSGYDVSTPLRQDGSCIGGHGETILVADFDGDGLVDIFLPSYERFDLLKNLGGGRFVEVAAEAGIAFPDYTPHVEGAAAVDIDGNGTIDIVAASEVLLNDGHGHFTSVDHPFGPKRLFDEGMAVADLDGDGFFDIVKSDPALGPRIFWGTANSTLFTDAGWMFGGSTVSARAYGVAVGDLMHDGRQTLVLAGGEVTAAGAATQEDAPGSSPPPRICVQAVARQFTCMSDLLPAKDNAWQDLLLVTDLDNDGYDDLAVRYGTLTSYLTSPGDDHVFRIDLRDAQGHRNQYGRTLRATCARDGSFVGLKFVDGGNGYMAQGNYVVSFHSAWCDRITLQVPSPDGPVGYGPFAPGLHVVRTAS